MRDVKEKEIMVRLSFHLGEDKDITLSIEEAKTLYEKLKGLFDNNKIITTYPWCPVTPDYMEESWKSPSTTGDNPIRYSPDVTCGPYDPNVKTGE